MKSEFIFFHVAQQEYAKVVKYYGDSAPIALSITGNGQFLVVEVLEKDINEAIEQINDIFPDVYPAVMSDAYDSAIAEDAALTVLSDAALSELKQATEVDL